MMQPLFTNQKTQLPRLWFRCGFLGLLHMEIIQERIRREYNLDVISTYPSVVYHVIKVDGEMLEVHNPVHLPEPSKLKH